MSHHHHHHHHETGNIKTAFFLNLFFTIIEIIGGILTNSVAVLSDAIHDLGDTISLGLSWYFQNVANKKKDKYFSYGYGRFSLLGALVSGIILFGGSIYILLEAIPRLIEPQAAHAEGMIALSILGIIINGLAVLKLSKGHSINEKVVRLHLMEDVLGWIGVLIGGIVIKFTGWYILDPILSLMIAAYILKNVYHNISEAAKIILQGVPAKFDMEKMEQEICAIEGILKIEDCHLWTMDGEFHILTLHIQCSETIGPKDQINIKSKIRENLKSYKIEHATIEIEFSNELSKPLPC